VKRPSEVIHHRSFLGGLGAALLVTLVVLLFSACGSSPAKSSRGKSSDSTQVAGKTRRKARAAVDTLAAKAGRGGKKLARGPKGKRGSLKAQTMDEKMTERKKLRDEKRRLRQEARRKRREEQLAQRAARSRGRKSGAKRSLYDAYTLKGTVAGRYALVGNRRLEAGDIIAGKKLVDVSSNRIVLEQFGTRFTVQIGEPVERGLGSKSGRKRK
jgi:hypothetical protein